MQYRYFVSYHHRTQVQTGYSNCFIDLNDPIRGPDDISAIEKNIREVSNGVFVKVVVLSFTLIG